jgi:large subunit ribosomal protein L9
MLVYLLKDIEGVGMAGHVIKVSDGYASNYLVPKKLAVIVTDTNQKFYKEHQKKEQVHAQVLTSKVAMLAERIKTTHLIIKERTHDDGKLYGAVGADEIIGLLKEKDIVVNKKQIEFDKAIKSVGEHKVTIKLSSKLKPQCIVKVLARE